MLKEIKYNSDINWGRRFRKYIIDELIRKNILKTDFTELEYIHKVLSSEWTVDRDYPASWNKLRRVLQDEINFTETYYGFLGYIYDILGYDFYFQKIVTVRVHCPQDKSVVPHEGYEVIDKDYRNWHSDQDANHPPEEINIWMSLCDMSGEDFVSLEIKNRNGKIKSICGSLDKFLIFNDGSDVAVQHSALPVFDKTRVSIDVRINPVDKYVPGYVGTSRMRAVYEPGGDFGYHEKSIKEILDEI